MPDRGLSVCRLDESIRYAEQRYDRAHEAWLRDRTRDTAEKLDYARISLYRIRRLANEEASRGR